jgi:hypothetical protein
MLVVEMLAGLNANWAAQSLRHRCRKSDSTLGSGTVRLSIPSVGRLPDRNIDGQSIPAHSSELSDHLRKTQSLR